MPLISRHALVPYSVHEMYMLVDDIESYPDFLPWCAGTEVLERTDQEVRASIKISRGALHKTFTTLNRIQADKMIEMRLLQGPFKHLEGYWRFDAIRDTGASKISLDLDFEFESKIMALTIGSIFNQIANTMVDAFTQRAVAVYGERG